jgi:mitochondrial-processing peptidase subunit beta
MGPDVNRRYVDRCWQQGRDRRDQWNGSFPGTSRFQGKHRKDANGLGTNVDENRARATDHNNNSSWRLRTWAATSMLTLRYVDQQSPLSTRTDVVQRENTVYYAKSFNNDAPKTIEILSDILQNSKLDPGAVERERDVILRESEEVDKQLEEVVFDHLHATAYMNQPLGRTILGTKENIASITRQNLVDYISTNYTADRMVLVSAGGTPHEELVKLAEKHFSGLRSRPPTEYAAEIAAEQKRKPEFVGSEVRVRDDTIPTAHIAIAVEGVSWRDDDYFTALVTQAIVGNWDRAMGQSPYMGSRLSTFVNANNLANSFMSFSTSYSDTG